MTRPDRFAVTPTGFLERVDEPHVDKVPEYNPRTREHFWITMVVYRVDPKKIDAGETLILDRSNLVMSGAAGCYHCEQTYEKRLTFRPCPGNPAS